MRFSAIATVATAIAIGVALVGCSATGRNTSRAGSQDAAVAVRATDHECQVGRTALPAGVIRFSVTNGGSKVTEFYVYAAGDRVMGEVENIAPGVTRELAVELAAGDYETACKPGMTGRGIRGELHVTGERPAPSGAPALAEATESYQRYVRSQTVALIDKTGEFAAAVKAGDIARAKALFPVARTYWERIEPVAEIFGDLDPAIDGREDDVNSGEEFTGFHRLEQVLWTTGDLTGAGPIADKLVADVGLIVEKANQERLSPLQLANGAKELLDEVATTKITGEEDRYSHTDLWDFAANLEGSKAAIAALRPVLAERAPDLVRALDERFAAAEATLARHRTGDGWRLHNELSRAELKALSDAINALGEPVSKVAAMVVR